MNIKNFTLLLCGYLLLTNNSCMPTPDPVVITPTGEGLYVLNEGSFGKNNSTLSYYTRSTSQVTADVFKSKNNADIGDTGNDLVQYGGKVYIVVNGSGKVEVFNARTGISVGKISFLNGQVNRNPRSITAYKGNIYVPSYDGTICVIDTTTLQISKVISTPLLNIEKVLFTNSKMYVCAVGKFTDYTTQGGLAVISDFTTYAITMIDCGKNLTNISTDDNGNIFVLRLTEYDSNYELVAPRIVIVNTNTDAVRKVIEYDARMMAYYNNQLFIVSRAGVVNKVVQNKVMVYNTVANIMTNENFIPYSSDIQSLYKISLNLPENEIYLTDAKDYQTTGEVFVYNNFGVKKSSFKSGGISPSKVISATLK